MQIHQDYSQLVLLYTDEIPWHISPGGEVQRRMLERNGAESGLATSIVKYPPGARFPKHSHPGGEEFWVLEGLFSDEHGDYPAGTYVRNPVDSNHAPFSEKGCLLFVKLWQMERGQGHCVEQLSLTPGLSSSTQTLYQDIHESVALKYLPAGQMLTVSSSEILLLEGEVQVAKTRYPAYSWFRIPPGQTLQIKVLKSTWLWMKSGHLEARLD